LGDEGLVGDDDFLAVEVGDGGGADADAVYCARQVADGYHIADAYRPLEQDDQSGDEVGEDFLQAEAQPDTQRRHQPLQLVPADSQTGPEADDADADDQIAEQGGDGIAAALAQLHARQHQYLQQSGNIARQGNGQAGNDERAEQVAGAERRHQRVVRGAAVVLPQGNGFEIGGGADQIGPDQIDQHAEQDQQPQAAEAQGLLVDLFQFELGDLQRGVIRGAPGRLFGLALADCPLIRQMPAGYPQVAHHYALQQYPGGDQIECIDHAVGQTHRGVVITPDGHPGQDQRRHDQQHRGGEVENPRVIQWLALAHHAADEQAEQGKGGDHHQAAQHILVQVFGVGGGHADHQHHGQQHPGQAPGQLAQPRDLGRRPAEVADGDALGIEQAVHQVQGEPAHGQV